MFKLWVWEKNLAPISVTLGQSHKATEANFYVKFQIRLSLVEPSICYILGMVGPIDVQQKENESTGCYAD